MTAEMTKHFEITGEDLVEQIRLQAITIFKLNKEIEYLKNEIVVRKEMMANYADMCEGYRKMNDEYHKMIEYYQHPHITKEYQVKLK